MKNSLLLIFCLLVMVSVHGQKVQGISFGLNHIGYTYDDPSITEGVATGLYLGVPITIFGTKHQLVFQPDVSFNVFHKPKSNAIIPKNGDYFLGLNGALKYSYMMQDGRFSAGYRSGFEATYGLYGIVLEYDHKFNENFMVGLAVNNQVFFRPNGGESFSGIKLQLTHLL